MSFKAFEDSTASLDIGGLTLENNEDRVSIYGSLNIGRDRQGLAQAKQLQTIINDMVQTLEQQNLPTQIETFEAKRVKNPFASDSDAEGEGEGDGDADNDTNADSAKK